MEPLYSVWFMMIGSFIIQLCIMSIIMVNTWKNIRLSTSKVYLSFIMALLMGILEITMYDIQMGHISTVYYVSLIFFLIIFIFLYRNQLYITDKDYLNEMIEHHSMALLTSEEILQKEPSARVKKLAENIITTQEKEIQYMKDIVVYE